VPNPPFPIRQERPDQGRDIQVPFGIGLESSRPDQAGIPNTEALGVAPRFPFSGKVKILDKSTRTIRGVAWGADLSCTGIGFLSPVELDLREFIVVEFEVNGTAIRLDACIMRHSGTGYGAEFLHVPAATRRIIETSFRNAMPH